MKNLKIMYDRLKQERFYDAYAEWYQEKIEEYDITPILNINPHIHPDIGFFNILWILTAKMDMIVMKLRINCI